MADYEVKMWDSSEVKASEAPDGEMKFEGYLAYFDNVDKVGDVIIKGAFANSLNKAKAEGKVFPIIEQHGDRYGINAALNTPIGYFEELKEDSKGLWVKGVLAPTSRGKDMYALLKNMPKGAMSMSIGYWIVGRKDPSDEDRRATGVNRYLTEVDLREGSIVTFPANEKARVEDVKAEAQKRRDLEKVFKEKGFSSNDATKIVAIIRDSGLLKDAQIEEEKKDPSPEINFLTDVLDSIKKVSTGVENDLKLQDLRRQLAQGFKIS